jgi:hypothetical protein
MFDKISQKLVAKFGVLAFIFVVLTIPFWLVLHGLDALASHSRMKKHQSIIKLKRSNRRK